jgi:hypothetical protein
MTAPKAIKKVFQGAIGHMAMQAWYVGHLDAALSLVDTVLSEAKENMGRFPKDKDCKEAVKQLTAVKNELESVSERLAQIAIGNK